jgi:uncharacterized protein YcaQ
MMRRHDGLSTREIRAAERAMMRELEKGPRTRSELRAAIPGLAAAAYWGREIRCLAQKGLVLHAGKRDGETLFDLRERWAPRSDLGRMPVRDARRELLLRYLAAYGSATPRDFAYWLGVRVSDVRESFRDAGSRILCAGDAFLLREAAPPPKRPVEAPPRLLPRFDPLLLGHKDKSRYLDARDYPKVFRPAAVIEPVVLVGGRVAGTWSYQDPERWRFFRGVAAEVRPALSKEATRVAALLR